MKTGAIEINTVEPTAVSHTSNSSDTGIEPPVFGSAFGLFACCEYLNDGASSWL